MNQAIVETEVRLVRDPDAVAPPRVDMYTLVHKGIRAFMGATLEALGRLDERDADEVAHTLAQVRSLASFLRAHLHHENQFVHPALEARHPGAARRTAAIRAASPAPPSLIFSSARSAVLAAAAAMMSGSASEIVKAVVTGCGASRPASS